LQKPDWERDELGLSDFEVVREAVRLELWRRLRLRVFVWDRERDTVSGTLGEGVAEAVRLGPVQVCETEVHVPVRLPVLVPEKEPLRVEVGEPLWVGLTENEAVQEMLRER
jgi:hypothetical protein